MGAIRGTRPDSGNFGGSGRGRVDGNRSPRGSQATRLIRLWAIGSLVHLLRGVGIKRGRHFRGVRRRVTAVDAVGSGRPVRIGGTDWGCRDPRGCPSLVSVDAQAALADRADLGGRRVEVVATSAALGLLMASMFGSLIALKVTSAGDKGKPSPTPQMMAPDTRPPDNASGVVYAVGTTYVDRGGY